MASASDWNKNILYIHILSCTIFYIVPFVFVFIFSMFSSVWPNRYILWEQIVVSHNPEHSKAQASQIYLQGKTRCPHFKIKCSLCSILSSLNEQGLAVPWAIYQRHSLTLLAKPVKTRCLKVKIERIIGYFNPDIRVTCLAVNTFSRCIG